MANIMRQNQSERYSKLSAEQKQQKRCSARTLRRATMEWTNCCNISFFGHAFRSGERLYSGLGDLLVLLGTFGAADADCSMESASADPHCSQTKDVFYYGDFHVVSCKRT
jgi:hypothetical protein